MIRHYVMILTGFFTIVCNGQTSAVKTGHRDSSIINLSEIIISGPDNSREKAQVISEIDHQLRPTNSAQDLLKLVPGLFIAQHAGGGKAEQIFLRGFDCDHGTDFSINIDGMPVNIVSHAHGQGYADFHFVIPETVEKLKVFKGTYNAAYGDFATAGAGEFATKNSIEKNQVKLEYGRFDTYRAMAMLDLLKDKHLISKRKENFYVAGEYHFSNSFLENKQHLNRINFFSKYSGQIGAKNFLVLSASTFKSNWDASGQIPTRAVSKAVIARFGSIDPSEGGNTGRTNLNSSLMTCFPDGSTLRNQVYYCHYNFNLFSNFTFFLHDPINGDQINQTENGRNIYGYKSSYEKMGRFLSRNVKSTLAIGTRIDKGEILLRHSIKRKLLDTISAGHLLQQNLFAFIDETIFITGKLSLNTAVRFDYFNFNYRSIQNDSLSGNRWVPKVSPKLNLDYVVSARLQLFARSGNGFHSNDARAVVQNKLENSLPTATGYETGATFKLFKSLIVNTAIWGLHLQNELVYVGDEAIVELTGATRRVGADLSIRWQLTNILFADLDLNYNHGRYTDLPKGKNYIPLSPSITSTGGLSIKQVKGFNASVRYRYIDTRPANEDNSVRALGYFLMDAVLNYSASKIEIGLTVENLLNTTWNEAQFDTESRLQGERNSVSELHYTPGTPFFVKAQVVFKF